MNFSIRKVKALTKKEMKSFLKNSNVLVMCLLPILFSVIYNNIFSGLYGDDSTSRMMIFNMCFNMNLIMVCSFVIAMLIAEEKEKNTLRTILLSGVSAPEFLAGKVLVTFILSQITNVLIFFIMGLEVQYLGWFLVISFLVVICMIEIGAVIGILSPNQMATGVIGMPVLMVLLLIPAFADLNEGMKKIAKFTPNYNMNMLFKQLFETGSLLKGEIMPFVVILIWVILSGAVFFITYNKVGLDK